MKNPIQKATKKPETVVKLDGPAPEILASAIVEVAESAKKLLSSKLTKRAVLLLIKDKCGVNMTEIDAVLSAAADLGSYVKR